MKFAYLWLDVATFLCPFLLSFDKKVKYFSAWRSALLASFIIAIPFLIWDAVFTAQGFWGFNPDYITGVYLFGLPIEEVLFFFVVPFACTFIYEVCKYFFRQYSLELFNKGFKILLPVYAISLLMLGDSGYYTLSVQISYSLVLIWMLLKSEYRHVPLAFCISLIPFLLMNGVLTGSVTTEPIVWYNEGQKVAPRIFTIPMEDVLYSFTLVVSNILVFEFFQKRRAL